MCIGLGRSTMTMILQLLVIGGTGISAFSRVTPRFRPMIRQFCSCCLIGRLICPQYLDHSVTHPANPMMACTYRQWRLGHTRWWLAKRFIWDIQLTKMSLHDDWTSSCTKYCPKWQSGPTHVGHSDEQTNCFTFKWLILSDMDLREMPVLGQVYLHQSSAKKGDRADLV